MVKKLKKMLIVSSMILLAGITQTKDVRADVYGDFSYRVNSNQSTVTITGYNGSDTEVTFPDTIDEKSVTVIESGYMWSIFGTSGGSVTKVTIPDSVTTIGDYAFQNCANLVNVKLPSGLKSIGDSAFSGCSSIISLELPDTLSAIGTYAFQECKTIKSITIPGKIPAIMDSAFEGCTGLRNVTIGVGVQMIKSGAFWNCTNLKSISIPESVISIGENAFGSEDAGIQIICKSGSEAETYARDNKLDYIIDGTDKVTHGNIEEVAAKNATGSSEGNIKYYRCTNCDKYYSDADGINEITKDSVIIKRHHIVYVESKEATALEDGCKYHYECTDEDCKKYFRDYDGEEEIDKNTVIIPKHVLTKVEAKEATFASEGNTEYYKCAGCDKLFEDADGTKEVRKNDVIIEKEELVEHVEACGYFI